MPCTFSRKGDRSAWRQGRQGDKGDKGDRSASCNRSAFWDDPRINKILIDFHEKRARFPDEKIEQLKPRLKRLLNEYVSALAQRGIRCRWVYAGSVSEGIRIVYPNNTIELDVEFRMDGSGLQVPEEGKSPCSVLIKPPENPDDWNLPDTFLDKYQNVSAELALNEFDVAFRDVIDSWEQAFRGDVSVVHKTQGPAERVIVSKDSREWLFLDFVPVLEVPGEGRYVAKQRPCGQREPFFWRHSYSDEEKNQYPSDAEKPYAKACLRILKAFAIDSEEMKKLDTYVWKNLLFWELRERPDDSWNEEDVARRVLGMLARLRTALSEGKKEPRIPQFFNLEADLLFEVSKRTRKEMHSFIDRLLCQKKEFVKVFTA